MWDPQAVSDPWLVEEEFGRRQTPAANGVEHEEGQAARETPAKTTRTGPLEFKDTATGKMLDVIQDNDPDLPASWQGVPRGARSSTSRFERSARRCWEFNAQFVLVEG